MSVDVAVTCFCLKFLRGKDSVVSFIFIFITVGKNNRKTRLLSKKSNQLPGHTSHLYTPEQE